MKTEQTHTLTFVAPLLISLIALACKDDGTTPQTPERVKLTLIDVSVRQAFLHVSVAGPAHNETLALQRDGTTAMTFAAIADTNVMDSALVQSTTYQYTASLTASNSLTGTSNKVYAQTLVPTSHNFTWQTFLLGDGNNSALYDAAIIGDSLAYAVGEIYLTGDPAAYNLVRWNGTSWSLLRIEFYTICGQTSRTPYPAGSLLAFDNSDVWIGMRGDQVATWNGNIQTTTACLPVSFVMNKLWGGVSSPEFAVGNGGNIMRYANGGWQHIESGTTTDILDAWGVVNPVTGKEEVYCAANSFFEPAAEKKILRITDGTHVDSVAWIGRLLTGVWTHLVTPSTHPAMVCLTTEQANGVRYLRASTRTISGGQG